MSWKAINQNSVLDFLSYDHASLHELDQVHDLISWKALNVLLMNLYSKKRGCPAYPPLMMFKILLLQSWYQLSDPAMEKQLARDLLFRRFVGLGLDAPLPDHSTLWRFRELLIKKRLLDRLFERVNHQLSNSGALIQSGSISIVDATVIEAKQSRPKKNKSGQSTQDPEADYTSKRCTNGQVKTTYGYKAHIQVEEDGFIQALSYGPANEHDSLYLSEVIFDDASLVYADSAYKSKRHDRLLGERNRILYRAYRNKPLTPDQKRENKKRSAIRSRVEGVFGVLKLHYGFGRARYLGLARNKAKAQLIAMSYNIKRALSILQSCAKWQDHAI